MSFSPSCQECYHTRALNLTGEQLQALAARCEQFTSSEVRESYGYPDSLGLCVVDAVQSTGVTHTSVGNVLDNYRAYRRNQEKSGRSTSGYSQLSRSRFGCAAEVVYGPALAAGH